MQEKLQELKKRLQVISDLGRAGAVLSWDQSTYMPPKGAAARGRQMATLSRIAHEHSTDPALGKLLDELTADAAKLPADSDDAALIRVAKRGYDINTRIPVDLLSEFTEHSAVAYGTWAEARPQNNFEMVRDNLEKTLDFSRRIAECFPGYEHIADPLIDFADYGMKASSVRLVFKELRDALVPLVEAITAQEEADSSCLSRLYPEAAQLSFSLDLAKDIGYDLSRGRLDKTHHPFETKFSIDDVRITTRVDENDLGNCLFSVLHEAGHAMYEQGINPEYEVTPLNSGTSAGVHESQSRLWENVVGRSRGFWEFYYPKLQAAFPGTLDDVSLDTFHKAINKVQRSLIRTEADEVTYNLHVMIRFELELQLLEGSLAIKDLPDAWNARYEADLGIVPTEIKNGVMQDVHWYAGIIGGSFQGYALGNILGGLFYDAALNANPTIEDEIRQGQFGTLLTWLQQNIYQYGSKYEAPDLIEKVTGGPLRIGPYMNYLTNKYSALYNL